MREGKRGTTGSGRFCIALLCSACLACWAMTATAAEVGKQEPVGKFQVVSGNDDKAYLVDTVTGAVWVLTYRTMATGREPIAIPYKFIRNTPKQQGDFLVESAGSNTSMPYSNSGQEK